MTITTITVPNRFQPVESSDGPDGSVAEYGHWPSAVCFKILGDTYIVHRYRYVL